MSLADINRICLTLFPKKVKQLDILQNHSDEHEKLSASNAMQLPIAKSTDSFSMHQFSIPMSDPRLENWQSVNADNAYMYAALLNYAHMHQVRIHVPRRTWSLFMHWRTRHVLGFRVGLRRSQTDWVPQPHRHFSAETKFALQFVLRAAVYPCGKDSWMCRHNKWKRAIGPKRTTLIRRFI